MKNFTPKLLVKMLVLGMAWTLAYALGFIQYLLYDPFQQTLGCTNAQLGLLMTIFGIGNVVGAPLGGWLADRYNYKILFVASLVGNGILSLLFAFNMSYGMAIWVWVGLAFTTLVLNYPSHIKIVRMLADEKNQGKIFGLNESFVGVGSILLNAVFLYIFARFATPALGMKFVVVAIGIASLVCAVLAWIITRDIDTAPEGKLDDQPKEEKVGGKDFLIVLKSPATWLQGLAIFSIYTCAVTMSYFTPYVTSVLGMTVAFSGSLSLIRTYALRLVGAPLGGVIADKIGSTSKSLILICALGILSMLAFLFMPEGTSVALVIFLILLVGCIVYMGKGIYYAVATELHVPKKYAATTVGVAAALGFSPDIFLFPLVGYWLDTYGNDGYRYIFIFQAAVMGLGILGSLYAIHYKKKLEARLASAETV